MAGRDARLAARAARRRLPGGRRAARPGRRARRRLRRRRRDRPPRRRRPARHRRRLRRATTARRTAAAQCGADGTRRRASPAWTARGSALRDRSRRLRSCSSHIIEHFTEPGAARRRARPGARDRRHRVRDHAERAGRLREPVPRVPVRADAARVDAARCSSTRSRCLGLEGDDVLQADFAARRAQRRAHAEARRAATCATACPAAGTCGRYERVLPVVYKLLGSKSSGVGSGIDHTHLFLTRRHHPHHAGAVRDRPVATPRVTAATTPTAAPPRTRRLSDRQKGAIVFGVIAIAFALPLRGLLRSQGPPMEEGFMLVFPERLLARRHPQPRLPPPLRARAASGCSPGSSRSSACRSRPSGSSASLQQVGVVFGVYLLARHWGRTIALARRAHPLLIIVPPIGLTALAWVGARRARAARAGGRARAPRAGHRDAGAARVAARRRRPRPASRSCSGPTSCSPSASARSSCCGGPDRSDPAAARRRRRARRLALRRPPRHGRRRATRSRGMVLDPVIYLRGGRRPARSRRRGTHLDGFLQRAGDLQQLAWPIPALEHVRSSCSSGSSCSWHGRVPRGRRRSGAARRARRRSRAASLLGGRRCSASGCCPRRMQRVDSAHFAWVSCVPLGVPARSRSSRCCAGAAPGCSVRRARAGVGAAASRSRSCC